MFPLRESGVIPTAQAVHQAAPPVAAVHRAAEAEAFNAENYLNFTENAVFSVWGGRNAVLFNVKNYEEY